MGALKVAVGEDDDHIALVNISICAWRDCSFFLTEFYSHGSGISNFFHPFLGFFKGSLRLKVYRPVYVR